MRGNTTGAAPLLELGFEDVSAPPIVSSRMNCSVERIG
jgi:hypothetical protein